MEEWNPQETQHHTQPQLVEFEGVLAFGCVYVDSGNPGNRDCRAFVCASVRGRGSFMVRLSWGHPSPVTIATPHPPNPLQTPISSFIRNSSRAELRACKRERTVSCTSKFHYNSFKTRRLESNPLVIDTEVHLPCTPLSSTHPENDLTPWLWITRFALHNIFCLFSHRPLPLEQKKNLFYFYCLNLFKICLNWC